jgi:hypothetical protein
MTIRLLGDPNRLKQEQEVWESLLVKYKETHARKMDDLGIKCTYESESIQSLLSEAQHGVLAKSSNLTNLDDWVTKSLDSTLLEVFILKDIF